MNKMEENNIEKRIKEEFWKKTSGALFVITIIMVLLVLIITMANVTPDKYTQILIGMAILGVFSTAVLINILNKTVGMNFAITLLKLRRLKNKGKGLFKEFRYNGIPKYHIIDFNDSSIKYTTKINGEKKQGILINHPFAKYEDFGAKVPVIEGSYSDIMPKNFFLGNRITTNQALIEKTIVESGISQSDLDDVKKHRRWLMYVLLIIAIAMVLSIDLFAQKIAEANAATIACYQNSGTAAEIVANFIWLPLLFTIKEGFSKYGLFKR